MQYYRWETINKEGHHQTHCNSSTADYLTHLATCACERSAAHRRANQKVSSQLEVVFGFGNVSVPDHRKSRTVNLGIQDFNPTSPDRPNVPVSAH